MKVTNKELLWAFAFLLVGIAYFFGLFIDLTGDSGLYAAISRQMVESGNWLNLKINGEPYDQKPHLFFWLAGWGIQLFGNTNFAFKIFPFLYGSLAFYFTYRLGKTIYSKEAGKIAALILATSQMTFLYFFDLHMDSIMQTGVVLALWQLAEYIKYRRSVYFVFGFAGIGLAMLSKGPVGAVLPFFAVLFYLLSERDYKQLFHPKWLIGILIALFIISPALIHLYNGFGAEGIKFFFVTNNVGRITGEYAGSSSDPFFYIYNMLWAFLPWTVFVVIAVLYEVKGWLTKGQSKSWSYYLLGSVLVLLTVLSIARGKAPNYFLIALAPLSLITAKWLVDSTNKGFLQAQSIFLFVPALFLLVLLFLIHWKVTVAVFVTLLTVVVAFLYSRMENKKNRLLFYSVLLGGALNFVLNYSLVPELYSYQGARQAVTLFEEHSDYEDQLYNFDLEEYELFFMAQKRVGQIKTWEQMDEAMKKSGTWLYTNETKYKEILEWDFQIDTVYEIRQRGMNRMKLEFVYPKTREKTLKPNYLVVTK